ncbi:MAG: hypothetical protein WCK02_02575 [Bacteroidota bacterium]
MKNIFLLFILIFSLNISCKTKKEAEVPPVENNQAIGKTVGTVSHQYRKSGCETVIVVTLSKDESPLILIPITKLQESLDVDGLLISFDYTKSKVKQPAGCATGIPVVITNAAKKK